MKKFLLVISMMLYALVGISQEISLGTGTTTDVSPINLYYWNSFNQQIFTKQEINADTAGAVTALKFYGSSKDTFDNTPNVKFWIGHTTKSNFTSTTDWISLDNLTLIHDAIISRAGGVTTITLATPFQYNNVDNIVIVGFKEATSGHAGYSSVFYNYTGSANTVLSKNIDSSSSTNPHVTLNNYQTIEGSRSAAKSRITFVGLTPNSIPTCPNVTAPSANATTVVISPTITWTAIQGAVSYNVKIGTTSGASDVLNQSGVTTNSFALTTPLLYNTTYFLTVEAVGTGGTSQGCTVREFKTLNIACPTITSPAVNELVSTTPTIAWNAVSNASGYKLTLGTTPGGNDVFNNIDLGNVQSYTIATTLSPNQTYYYKITSYTSNTESSGCTERRFKTACAGTQTIPWNENFDNVLGASNTYSEGLTPDCWSSFSKISVMTNVNSYVTPRSGNNAMVIQFSTHADGAWAFTPAFDLQAGTSYRFKMYYKNYNATAFTDFKVALGTAQNKESMTRVLNTIPSVTNTVYRELIVDFTPQTNGIYYIGVSAKATFSPYYLSLDDFSLDFSPSCPEPTNITSASITHQSAVISWNSIVSSFDLYYATTDVAPTATTQPTYTNVSSPYTLTNLNPTQAYYVWVRSNCGSEMSNWYRTTFTTLATPPANDECENAITLTPGVNFAQNAIVSATTSATNNTNIPTPTCDYAGYTTNGKDVWFKVTIPASRTLTIETNNNGDSGMTDTGMSAYSGTCANLSFIECDADDSSDGAFSLINLTGRTPGEEIFVRVWGYNTNVGSFKISAYDATLSSEDFSQSTVKLYPNPFTTNLNISNSENIVKATVTDMSGKVVKSFNNPTNTLELSELSAGIYMVTLQNANGSNQTIKAIKK